MKTDITNFSTKPSRYYKNTRNEMLKYIPDKYFDCILFLDILEHLVDPYSLLTSVKEKLTKNGIIVASIPNVRYFRNYIEFSFKGNWDYKNSGTLDKTHLRFFTYKSLLRMFDSLGFEILTIEGINSSRNFALRVINILFFNRLNDLKHLQFAVVARPNMEA